MLGCIVPGYIMYGGMPGCKGWPACDWGGILSGLDTGGGEEEVSISR